MEQAIRVMDLGTLNPIAPEPQLKVRVMDLETLNPIAPEP